jgi:UDP-glucose 4-epimerase
MRSQAGSGRFPDVRDIQQKNGTFAVHKRSEAAGGFGSYLGVRTNLVQTHLITGAAGFIGSNLAACLRQRGDAVVLVDNLSNGKLANLRALQYDRLARFARTDCADAAAVLEAVKSAGFGKIDQVWHLAANSDVAAGVADWRIDVRDTFLTTTGVLAAMQVLGLRVLNFASSSAVYGDFGGRAVDEEAGPLQPISNYGAMKLASEALIRAACESFLESANIFRFPNVVGVPATHGVLLDFVRKLRATPCRLEVLGDGRQKKPYLHASDLVDAMLFAAAEFGRGFNVLNIGPADDGVSVREIAEITTAAVSPDAEIAYGTSPAGWVGDVPRFSYSLGRLRRLGWCRDCSSKAAIRKALREIIDQERETTCSA